MAINVLWNKQSGPNSFNRDPEFYAFTRSLNAYQQTFASGRDIMLLQPDSQFFQYLGNPEADK